MSANTHICSADGCAHRAVKRCFDCGAWRCAEHLVPTVHERKGAVVHLCPGCLQAYLNEPEHLPLVGVGEVSHRATRHPLDDLLSGEGSRIAEDAPWAKLDQLAGTTLATTVAHDTAPAHEGSPAHGRAQRTSPALARPRRF